MRIEVPFTSGHWETAYLAPEFELARGWLRQLDTTRDDLFYDEKELTAATYGAWLRSSQWKPASCATGRPRRPPHIWGRMGSHSRA